MNDTSRKGWRLGATLFVLAAALIPAVMVTFADMVTMRPAPATSRADAEERAMNGSSQPGGREAPRAPWEGRAAQKKPRPMTDAPPSAGATQSEGGSGSFPTTGDAPPTR